MNNIVKMNNFSQDEFYENRNNIDMDLHKSFNRKFNDMLNFYKSLSTLNSYRKVQKISIINTPQSDDIILNLLNKITDVNYERISEKVLLKLKENNLISFINQILKYSEKSKNNSILLWDLINYLYKEYIDLFKINNENITQNIEEIINNYITLFLKELHVNTFIESKTKNLTKEEYNEFVDRIMNNSALFAKMKMICIITGSKSINFKINYDINEIYDTLINELKISVNYDVSYKEKLENINNNILECVLIMIKGSNKLSYYEVINVLEDIKTMDKLSNKNKFKLLDIIDKARLELKN